MLSRLKKANHILINTVSYPVLRFIFPCILLAGIPCALSEVHTVYLKANPYTLVKTESNQVEIQMQGFGRITVPGSPGLPSRVFCIALPSNASVLQVTVNPVGRLSIPGKYPIPASLPLVPSNSDKDLLNSLISGYLETKEKIYTKDTFFPDKSIEYLDIDYLGKCPVVKVRFTPIQYNPVTGALQIVEEVAVQIDYTIDSATGYSRTHRSGLTLQDISEPILLDKIDALSRQDNSSIAANAGENALLIIGPQELESAVGPFIFWKSCLGFSVQFVTTEWIYSQMNGESKTEKIRNFLKDKYFNDDVCYVLFIGHLFQVPMEKLYPDPSSHRDSDGIPSDFYYAELSGEWDSDGDGFPGEFGEDDLDWIPEINIGRIPWSDSTTVSQILQKIIKFDRDRGTWKNQALLIGAISNYKNENNYSYYDMTDGAALMEILKHDLFNNTTVKTLYEKGGVQPSDYHCDLPLNMENIASSWSSGTFGCVTWWSHGNYKRITRRYWKEDDGDEIPEYNEIEYDNLISVDDYPVNDRYQPIIFANACDNGWPEKTSLARKMIKNSCTGIISSSRVSWYVLAWNDIQDGGNASMAYYFWKEFLGNTQSTGKAVYYSKLKYLENFNDAWQHIHNVYTFNFFGDPTLKLYGSDPTCGGITGSVVNEDSSSSQEETFQMDLLGTSISTVTDENGNFQFKQIPAGSYVLQVTGENFEPVQTDVTVINGEMILVDVLIPAPSSPEAALSASFLSTTLHEESYDTRVVALSNSGSETLKYHTEYITAPPSWLTTDTTLHTIDPGASDTIRFVFHPSDIDQGNYQTQIRFSTNDPANPLFHLPITMHVIDTIPPAPIWDLYAEITESDSISLTWTAPGDNELSGRAERYEIWIGEQPVQEDGLEHATLISGSLIPGLPGTQEQITLFVEGTGQHKWITIQTLDEGGLSSNSNSVSFIETDVLDWSAAIPTDFVYQNYPNPFNATTTILFSTAKESRVRVTIFNETGQAVNILLDRNMEAGRHTVTWNATDSYGRELSSGIYFFAVETSMYRTIKKMVLVK